MANRNILLIEPGYKNKYPPLGLMKIAQYHGPRGKNDNVRFIKGEDRSVLDTAWDRIYVTTLFSFEYQRIAQTIDFALEVANHHPDKVFVGGIAASLMHERFLNEPKWSGVRFIKGLLSAPPAVSLELDEFSEELYAEDVDGTPIEDLVPDYSILDQIDYQYPVRDAYFAYCSRGCIRKCHFCGVPKLEGALRDTESLTSIVRSIDELYGPKRDLMLMDNNVVALPRFREIIAEIRDLGFVPGAKLARPGRAPVQRRVDFNQGVDARILCKDPMYLRELSTICLKPLRIAFDHLGVRKPYEQAVRYAAEFGLTELSNYMLYNFHDGPRDLFERMRLNVTLNEELGIRIWSFPMRFQPTDRPDRTHIGEKWSRYQLRSMQIILQATHGIVSGEPTFFKRAFGDTFEDYERILMMPHDFIFNRDWYENYDSSGALAEFWAHFARLDAYDLVELRDLLSSVDPRHFNQLPARATTKAVRDILGFYEPIPKAELFRIWEKKRAASLPKPSDFGVPDDERVEDAGLDAEEPLESTNDEPSRRAAWTYDILTSGPTDAGAGNLAPPSVDDVTVGKDLLELLSAGMYVDPMSIYREYVQNAADAIDQARSEGLIRADEQGRIDIVLTPTGRSIRIRDNGTGVKRDDFVRTLLAVGGSRKRGSSLRGFRGVGRLAGLAYAQEVIFRSRATGESDVAELRWDSRRLKTALRDGAFEGGIDRLILHCADTRTIPAGDFPARFFEVELKGVIRLRADRLMTAAAVEEFLAQQAPVPFSPDFRHGTDIAAALRAAGVPLPVHIHLDGRDTPLYRPHRDHFHLGNGHEAAFTELELREVPDMDGGPAALAWVLHHDYVGAIPSGNLIKGIRMRVGDLQVGGAHVLEECFAEPRFNSWSVGEVHVLDRRITPNARRDDFEQNVHHNNLLNHLSPLFREISRRCRGNSIRRNWLRKLDLSLAKARDATTAPASHHELVAARDTLAEASRIAAMPTLAEEDLSARRSEITAIGETLDELHASPLQADPFAGFTSDQRFGAERVLELITACSDDQQAASGLIARIMQRLGSISALPQSSG